MEQKSSMKAKLLKTGVLLVVTALSCSCRPAFNHVYLTDVPVRIYAEDNSDYPNVDIIREDVQTKVSESIPGAMYKDFLFSGKCSELPAHQGTMLFTFQRVQNYLNGKQVIFVTATVDTRQQTVKIEALDESSFYPNLQQDEPTTEAAFGRITQIAYQHINQLGLSNCNVTITQQEDHWDVRCGAFNDFEQKCWFAINSSTQEIERPRPPQ
jgi:hypothetical protein